MKIRIVLVLALSIVFRLVHSQSSPGDTIINQLKNLPDDSIKVGKLIDYCNTLRGINLSDALELSDMALNISNEIGYVEGIARSNNMIGFIYSDLGEYEKASEYFYSALRRYESIKHKLGLAKTYNALGLLNYSQTKFENALNYYFKALNLMDELDYKLGMSEIYTNIGIIYFQQRDTIRSVEYFKKDLQIAIEINNQNNIAISYNNLAYIYQNMQNYDSAIYYNNKSLEIQLKLNNKKGIADSYSNIGTIYSEKQSYDTATDYYFKSLKIQEDIGDKKRITNALINLGYNFYEANEFQQAIKYSHQALESAEKIDALFEKKDAYKILADAYFKIKEYEKAYNYSEKYATIKDSIFDSEISQQMTRLENKYEIGKKEKEIAMKDSEIKQNEEKVRRQRIVIFAFIGGFIIILLFSIILMRLNKRIKHKNYLLAEQKEEIMMQRDSLELLNSELEQQKEEITSQRDDIERKSIILKEAYDIIESKNKNITASIRYAQRIQQAILPPEKFINTFLHDSFILFMPKDIVSGDFYWMEVKDNKVFFAAVDCTGHGVPGAFMSILAKNILSQALNEERIEKPSEILNFASMIINKTLRQKSGDLSIKDGMDLALCVIDKTNYTLEFAGAFNPAYVVRNKELFELKGDKYPIGEPFTDKFKSYNNFLFNLQKNDIIYSFSDGYQDQFGGTQKKKFLTKRLRELFIEISHEPLQTQKLILKKTFEEWKGSTEQIDDVLIIGVKVV